MLKRLKQSLANRLLRYLYNATTEDDFMRVLRDTKFGSLKGGIAVSKQEDSEQWEQLPDAEVRNLANEAKAILALDVYHKSLASLRNDAKNQIFNKSKTTDDLLFPKAILYTVSILDKKLRAIAKLV